MPELLILSGLPASGKTTRALEYEAQGYWRVNWDELRLQLFGAGWKFNRKEEELMQEASRKQAAAALALGHSVVVDNTNLTERSRNKWAALGKDFGATIVHEDLDTPVHECVKRDRTREKRVGQAVIDRMALFHGWIDWNDPDLYPMFKKFVVVDVDGTLADCEHRRHYVRPVPLPHSGFCTFAGNSEPCPNANCAAHKKPKKDWPSFFRECDKDDPIRPIFKLVRMLESQNHIPLIVSGRPIGECGVKTEDWLLKYGLDPVHLFMRDSSDSRDDTIVKQEIAELLPMERIAYVIDDRPKVLRMWRELGLFTLAVGNGEEF